jgi:hypothetical protein
VSMNALLFQMIAARGNSGNPAIADLMARMQGSGGGSPNLDAQQLLARLGNDNPAVSALLKRIEELKANTSPREDGPVIDAASLNMRSAHEDSATTDEITEDVDDDSRMLSDLRERIQNLLVELRGLREQNNLLARALGACECWGQNLECRNCGGQGVPGSSLPNKALVCEYVVPAIRVLRERNAKLRDSPQRRKPELSRVHHPAAS